MADLPQHERPRERLLRHGPDALTDRELLALVMRHGRPGESALDLATSLLVEYGDLAALARARPEELAIRAGIGTAKAAALAAAFQLGSRAREESSRPVLRSAADVADAVQPGLAWLRRERVMVLVCDAGNRLRHAVVLTEGAADRALIPVREVLNATLRHDGRAFAVAHNHPSGDPTPSEADVRATAELCAAAKTVGLRFLDHVVVAGEEWRSVATECVLAPR
jgi:DNA repair protein RadC